MKSTFKFLIPGILIIAALSYVSYERSIYNPVDTENTENISFQIKKGETVKEIAANLEEKELIDSDFYFYLHVKFNNLGENILAGRFLINQSMNAPEILEILSDPSQSEYVITIQEGLRIRDIDDKLVELELIETGEFINEAKNFNGWEYYSFLDQSELSQLEIPIEGYVYPDTYFLDPATFEPHDLIYLALNNFESKFSDLEQEIKRHSINEIITMASIIENEVFGEEDRKLVSGILWKRVEAGWMIGADATLLYITEDRTITSADLEIDSPYNTRKYSGLPPGPICNPSIESIEAAMYPTENEHWFYLTTLEGEVIYSYSNEEHNTNRAKYL